MSLIVVGLNHRTAPDVPVAMAVRMSMSIPFVWREVVWQKEWGTYCGIDKTARRLWTAACSQTSRSTWLHAQMSGSRR